MMKFNYSVNVVLGNSILKLSNFNMFRAYFNILSLSFRAKRYLVSTIE